ncbi:MAG: hypothetical protein IJT31_07070 [Oscillibacter sp.]|nr:hypothetical protein [Oscillibacter sp.]
MDVLEVAPQLTLKQWMLVDRLREVRPGSTSDSVIANRTDAARCPVRNGRST